MILNERSPKLLNNMFYFYILSNLSTNNAFKICLRKIHIVINDVSCYRLKHIRTPSVNDGD